MDLIANGVRELKTIEYKLILPGTSNDHKKEFLADVSSFANASGGVVVYGMREEDATAVELVGLDLPSIDKEILRLEGIIRDGLDPRLPNVMIRPIALQSGRVSFLIRVPRSWLLPHRVKYGGTSRFYSRTSAGKYELDVSELRPLFALSTTATERIRDFRTERLSKIMAQEIPVKLNDNPRIVLHIVPLMAFDQSTRFDISSRELETDSLEPMGFLAGHAVVHNITSMASSRMRAMTILCIPICSSSVMAASKRWMQQQSVDPKRKVYYPPDTSDECLGR